MQQSSAEIDIQMTRGFRNVLVGGEGLRLAAWPECLIVGDR